MFGKIIGESAKWMADEFERLNKKETLGDPLTPEQMNRQAEQAKEIKQLQQALAVAKEALEQMSFIHSLPAMDSIRTNALAEIEEILGK